MIGSKQYLYARRVLGERSAETKFIKKKDIPRGEHKGLTVVAPGNENGVELLLEPMGYEPAKIYQKQLFDAGIPAAVFGTMIFSRNMKDWKKWVLFSNQNPKLWGR